MQSFLLEQRRGRLAGGCFCRDGILEYYWGEHIHLGYYTQEERARGYKKKDFKQAKFDFVDEMLRWSGATSPSRVLDVGCGIGGTSRHLAAKFPGAQVQGKSWRYRCCTLLHVSTYHPEESVRSEECTAVLTGPAEQVRSFCDET